MLAKTPLRDQMIFWLQQQSPETTYNWDNGCDCACARFARDIGREEEWAAFLRSSCNPDSEWYELNRKAGPGIHDRNSNGWRYPILTYAQLLERLCQA